MKRHVRTKFLFIIAVILICIYGIIGVPTSKADLIANWNKNIHLGLDLRGGTYLVVQVQQQDAFNAQAGGDAERLKDAMHKSNVQFADVSACRQRRRERCAAFSASSLPSGCRRP